jgi:hypothetical protein
MGTPNLGHPNPPPTANSSNQLRANVDRFVNKFDDLHPRVRVSMAHLAGH